MKKDWTDRYGEYRQDLPAKPPFIRTEYNYDMNAASDASGLHCEDESRTQQSPKEETDINTIVERFGITGQLPQNIQAPQNANFTEIHDFKTAMNEIVTARESFQAMPANVRARFHNDAAEFVDFCSDEGNRAEMDKLGLLTPKLPENPPEVALEPKGDTQKGVT